MIVPIVIDTGALADVYRSITPEQIDNLCDSIAKTLAVRYAQQLEQEAHNSLHQTRRRYIQAINVVDSGRLEGTVILDFSKDPMVRMLEMGASAFDLKKGLLNSPKVKTGADGRKYITIPFRIATPGAVADSDAFSGQMPQAVYNVVKEQETTIPYVGGLRSKGLTVSQLPTQYQARSKRAVINDSAGQVLFKEYIHKNPIYEGLTKNMDSVTGQNTYNSFRRVSETDSVDGRGSDPDSWIHKGIQQYNLVSKALNNFNQETEVGVSLNNELKKLGL